MTLARCTSRCHLYCFSGRKVWCKSRTENWKAVIRILRYLHGARDHGILFRAISDVQEEPLPCIITRMAMLMLIMPGILLLVGHVLDMSFSWPMPKYRGKLDNNPVLQYLPWSLNSLCLESEEEFIRETDRGDYVFRFSFFFLLLIQRANAFALV